MNRHFFIFGFLRAIRIQNWLPAGHPLIERRSPRVGDRDRALGHFAKRAFLFAVACFTLTSLGMHSTQAADPIPEWKEIAPDVWRCASSPYVYAICEGPNAVVIGAAEYVSLSKFIRDRGVEIRAILVTHHHRDSTASAARWISGGYPVRAPAASAPWLTPEGVRTFWRDSLPEVTPGVFPPLFHRCWAKWQYWVHPEGIEGIRCDLVEGEVATCGQWKFEAIATPGHSPDHMAFVATHPRRLERIAFCGDAYSKTGKMWTPYTTDWHHQNADGLNAAAESLRKLAHWDPNILCPEHGEVVLDLIQTNLSATADALKRVAKSKSYAEYVVSQRKVHQVDFLAPNQVGTATPDGNTRPWTKISPHLVLSGNTYALLSKDGPILLMDPYSQGLPGRLEELRKSENVGDIEAMLISHAHNDHYTGAYAFPEGQRPPVWTLDRIADVISDPDRYHAPYVDPRPLAVDRRLKDGEKVTWREYELQIRHQAGQTTFAMSVETVIDGKKVCFTGDNFYRADQYSGSGGWSGHNRGLPGGYAQSIDRLIKQNPQWILAEHGGAFTFNKSEFEQRLGWAQEAIAAANGLSPTGDNSIDWNPHRFRFETAVLRTTLDGEPKVRIIAEQKLPAPTRVVIRFASSSTMNAPLTPLVVDFNGQSAEVKLPIKSDLTPGSYSIAATARFVGEATESDVVLVLKIEP